MNAIEQARFNPLYEQMLQALKLQGKRPKTIEAYSRAVRRHAATRLEALLRPFKLRWEDA